MQGKIPFLVLVSLAFFVWLFVIASCVNYLFYLDDMVMDMKTMKQRDLKQLTQSRGIPKYLDRGVSKTVLHHYIKSSGDATVADLNAASATIYKWTWPTIVSLLSVLWNRDGASSVLCWEDMYQSSGGLRRLKRGFMALAPRNIQLNTKAWVLLVIPDANQLKNEFMAKQWSKIIRFLWPFEVHPGVINCHYERSVCMISTHNTKLRSLCQRSVHYNQNWILFLQPHQLGHGDSTNKVGIYANKLNKDTHAGEILRWIARKLEIRLTENRFPTLHPHEHARVVLLSKDSTVPMFFTSLSIKYIGRARFCHLDRNSYIEGHAERKLDDKPPRYIIVTQSGNVTYGGAAGQALTFACLDSYIDKLIPNTYSVAFAVFVFLLVFSVIDFIFTLSDTQNSSVMLKTILLDTFKVTGNILVLLFLFGLIKNETVVGFVYNCLSAFYTSKMGMTICGAQQWLYQRLGFAVAASLPYFGCVYLMGGSFIDRERREAANTDGQDDDYNHDVHDTQSRPTQHEFHDQAHLRHDDYNYGVHEVHDAQSSQHEFHDQAHLRHRSHEQGLQRVSSEQASLQRRILIPRRRHQRHQSHDQGLQRVSSVQASLRRTPLMPRPRFFTEEDFRRIVEELLVSASTVEYDRNNDESEKCCICFEPYKKGDILYILITCEHFFHRECVMTWFQETRNCPLCREKAL